MIFRIHKSLASRIVFYVLTLCVFLFLISLSVFYAFSKRSIQEMTTSNARALTQNTVFKTGQVLASTEKIAINYRALLESNQINYDSVEFYTRLIIQSNPEILGCAIGFEPNYFPEKGRYYAPYTYRENGNVQSILLGSADYEYFIMDWYQIPALTGKPYWSEPYYDTGGSEALVTTFSLPFYEPDSGSKKLVGIITIDLSLKWLTDIISSVHILETGYASVISRNGTFVTHPNQDLIMNQTIFSYAAELGNSNLRTIGRNMQAGKTDFASITLNETNWIISYTPIPESNWSLAVVFPEAEMFAPLKKISWVLILLIITGLGLLSLIVIRIVTLQIAPLRHFSRSALQIADGNFNTELPLIKTEDEMKMLHDSFGHMQKDLKSYIENLKETTSAKEKIESELRIAREIQMGMIPKIFPPFPNLVEIDLFAMLEPAKEVGGDLYDFFLIDDNHLCFAIGDVSGKGVPASLFMAVTRTLLRSIAPKQTSPQKIATALNNSLSTGNESSMFVTFFIGILNIKTGRLKYVNAGHNPPLLLTAGGEAVFFETSQDIPLGLFSDREYQESERILKTSDCLFLYTDGVTEAENRDNELYSEQKLTRCLKQMSKIEPRSIIEAVATDLAAHVSDNEQSDDITMLSIIYYGR